MRYLTKKDLLEEAYEVATASDFGRPDAREANAKRAQAIVAIAAQMTNEVSSIYVK